MHLNARNKVPYVITTSMHFMHTPGPLNPTIHMYSKLSSKPRVRESPRNGADGTRLPTLRRTPRPQEASTVNLYCSLDATGGSAQRILPLPSRQAFLRVDRAERRPLSGARRCERRYAGAASARVSCQSHTSMSNPESKGSTPCAFGKVRRARPVSSQEESRHRPSPVRSTFLLPHGEEERKLEHAQRADAVTVVIVNYHAAVCDHCCHTVCGGFRIQLGVHRFCIGLTEQAV